MSAGQRVRAGQPLLTLDLTATGADREQALANLQAAEVDRARGQAPLAALRGSSNGGLASSASAATAFAPPAGTPPHIVATQRQLIASRLSELNARVATLQQQAAEARAMEAGARAEMARLADTLPYLAQRVEARRQLAEKGFSSRLLQLELEQQRTDHQRQIAVQRENAARAAANAAGVLQQIAMARAEAERQVLADLAKAEADARLAREELTKADRAKSLQVVRSPADGVVQQLAVYAQGAVLKAADPILVVVPDDAKLIVEAQVLNRDVGHIQVGQPVTIKLEAFPFTRHGVLTGTLTWISPDAVQDEKLGPVYTARISVKPPGQGGTTASTSSSKGDGGSSGLATRGIRIAPGLSATAEIKTDERRVIDYLLSPLERRVSEAGRER